MSMDREPMNSALSTARLDLEDEILQVRNLACTIAVLVEDVAKRAEMQDEFANALMSSLIGHAIDMSHKACGLYSGYYEQSDA
jgi:hypothetical protein